MQALFDLLGRFSEPLLVIGGHSLSAHGLSRQTVDVDCLITSENREMLNAHLRSGGFELIGETENFARFAHPSNLVPDVDVLFVDTSTFKKLHIGGIAMQRGPVTLRVPSLPHLIALKLHAIRNNPAREARDLGDITELLRANPGKVSTEELTSLCSQFATTEISEKLKSLQSAL